MDAIYSRRHASSRLERLLAHLVPAKLAQQPVATRIDFARSEDLEVEVTQA
ncbi:hypothetical protein [Nocardioides terrisoli]|uniref:hypothetical protein n=1 Tax=Nocardioides terrisoli TaxID=3388267 RepID=UPI00287BC642|nr:hypothetical protein [Nocardioides marmorisolisilvae]